MRKFFAVLCAFVAAGVLSARADTVVRFHTSLGDIDVQLFPDAAPNTVANFLARVDEGSYTNTFALRVYPHISVQGGSFNVDAYDNVLTPPVRPSVANEFHLSNTRGTLAMTKAGTSNDSDSSLWFFNLADNSATLDNQAGGYTVFGRIINAQGLSVLDAIASVPLYNWTSPGETYLDIPLFEGLSNKNRSADIAPHLVYTHIARLPASSFFTGETSLSSGVYYLSFSQTGNPFGYFSYLANANYLYHFDLGYEYIFDANDGKAGVYLYDFTSGHFFYTSPSFGFPYLYDFSLNAVLYYYPDPGNPGRYNTDGTRFFYNYSTGKIFVQ